MDTSGWPRPRAYEERDNDPIRELLRGLLTADREAPHCWPVLRWDYWVTHVRHNCEWQVMEDVVVVWEAADGSIVAVANPEGAGQGQFQVRPGARSGDLDRAMLAAMEERMTAADPAGRRLLVWVPDDDPGYAALLAGAGYDRTRHEEQIRVRHLDVPLPEVSLAAGYRIREGDPVVDFPERGVVTHLVFNPGADPSGGMTAADYEHVRSGPLYRPDMDLVVEAPDGRIAAFCNFWFDPIARTVDIEPIGTDAAHRGRGLGKAILVAGLRRARDLGATHAYVGSADEPAHRLYASVGLETKLRRIGWRRRWS
jgi:GNAT superfamily N-acetyltransferase